MQNVDDKSHYFLLFFEILNIINLSILNMKTYDTGKLGHYGYYCRTKKG